MCIVVENFLNIRKKIPENITLTVVCKKQSIEKILPIIKAGHKDFAENYIQEAKGKWQDVEGVNLKLIGNLQSNKIKEALEIFDEIHTIDSLSKAEKIAKIMTSKTKTKRFYLQVNIGKEDQKNGIEPEKVIECVQNSPVEISGLMCIPPFNESPRKFFQEMQKIRQDCENATGRQFLLSMGMSGDFEEAILCKSNEIRVGTAIFGPR